MYIGNGFRLDQGTKRLTPYCPRPLAFSRRALREGGAYIHQPSTFFTRAAWDRVGGLNENLKFCMDWDVIMRVAALYPVALIDAFLATTREYDETKTAAGGMERAAEIRRMIEANTGEPLSIGAAIFMIEAMLHPSTSQHLGLGFFRHLSRSPATTPPCACRRSPARRAVSRPQPTAATSSTERAWAKRRRRRRARQRRPSCGYGAAARAGCSIAL